MKWLLHALFGLVALAFLAGCLFAIWWIWSIKKPAIDKTTRAFEEADKYMTLADRAVDDVKSNLEAARRNLAPEILQPRNAPMVVQDTLIRAAAGAVAPNLNDVQHTLERVTEASIVVNTLLESLEDRPLGPLDRLDADQVRNLQAQINEVTKASWRLGNALDDQRTSTQASPAERAQRISKNLGAIIDMSNDFQQRLRRLHARVDQIRDSTFYWMNLAPILATIVLGWIAISQVVVLVVAVKSRRSEVRGEL